MNALRRLEQGGFQFSLSAGGQITWRNTWRDDAPDEWLQPLMAELRERRAELIMILQRRQEWSDVYDEWSERLATAADDPARDRAALLRLEALAVAGQMPCYDGGEVDLGAEGWRRVTDRQLADMEQNERDTSGTPDKSTISVDKEKQEMGIKIEQTTYDAVPTGDYKAVITGIEQVEGKFGPQLQIKCEINAGPHAGNTFLCWVSPRFSPKSRLYEWVEAVLAMPVPRTYTFDSDHLIGREVIATLVVRELDGGGEVNRVDRVRAITNYELRITN